MTNKSLILWITAWRFSNNSKLCGAPDLSVINLSRKQSEFWMWTDQIDLLKRVWVPRSKRVWLHFLKANWDRSEIHRSWIDFGGWHLFWTKCPQPEDRDVTWSQCSQCSQSYTNNKAITYLHPLKIPRLTRFLRFLKCFLRSNIWVFAIKYNLCHTRDSWKKW